MPFNEDIFLKPYTQFQKSQLQRAKRGGGGGVSNWSSCELVWGILVNCKLTMNQWDRAMP